jgi:hypothetical protein
MNNEFAGRTGGRRRVQNKAIAKNRRQNIKALTAEVI